MRVPAVHAVRHLAYLRRTDPLVAATATAAPELWSRIDELDPALAGRRVDPIAGDPVDPIDPIGSVGSVGSVGLVA